MDETDQLLADKAKRHEMIAEQHRLKDEQRIQILLQRYAAKHGTEALEELLKEGSK